MDPRDYNTGIEIHDLLTSPEFTGRPERPRPAGDRLAIPQRLSQILTDSPDNILQKLCEAACDICGADSAGISMEAKDGEGNPVFHWVALTGVYAHFRNAMLPQDFMPCKVCIEERRPQLVRVPSEHFKRLMNVDAVPITDGMLLPWVSDGQRATIWVLAHDRRFAFDRTDYELLEVFGDFAAIAYRNLQQNGRAVEVAAASGADAMAHTLAHIINNPLQGLMNTLHLAMADRANSAVHTRQAAAEANQLSAIVKDLLAVYRIRSVQ